MNKAYKGRRGAVGCTSKLDNKLIFVVNATFLYYVVVYFVHFHVNSFMF
mgnify:CR=1 FL=1